MSYDEEFKSCRTNVDIFRLMRKLTAENPDDRMLINASATKRQKALQNKVLKSKNVESGKIFYRTSNADYKRDYIPFVVNNKYTNNNVIRIRKDGVVEIG